MELIQRNKLVLENMRLVERLAKIVKQRRSPPQVNYDDLISVGTLALIEALEKYEGRGLFKSFATKRIRGAMSEYVFEIRHWGRRHNSNSVPDHTKMSSLDEHLADDGWDDSSLICHDEFVDDFEELTQVLPESGRQLMRWYFVEGLTYKQIGERLGVVESRVAQRMRKCKDELKAAYGK